MIAHPVKYASDIKEEVAKYEALPFEEKRGDYWERTDNEATLKDVKRFIKNYYLKAQNFTCAYCQQKIKVDHHGAWDLEHIIPKDSHPQFLFEPENLCIVCKDCNLEKSNKPVLKKQAKGRLPRKSGDYMIFHPHFDVYAEEIAIVENPLFFIPKTDKGKKTIEVCGLLRFLFEFSNYGDMSIDVKDTVSKLNQRLQDASNPIEQTAVLSLIGHVVNRGLETAKQDSLKALGLAA